jgi:hypothetical protein
MTMTELTTLFADHYLGHSDHQMDWHITARHGGTLYGCYRQALRELWKRYRGLRELYALARLVQIDLAQLDASGRPRHATDFDGQRAAVERARKRLSLQETCKAIEHTEREFVHFYGQAIAIREKLGIDADNPLTPERRADFEREMWLHKIKATAACDYMTAGRLQRDTIERLAALPSDLRCQIAAQILIGTTAASDGLIAWWLTYDPGVPAPARIEQSPRELLGDGPEITLAAALSCAAGDSRGRDARPSTRDRAVGAAPAASAYSYDD